MSAASKGQNGPGTRALSLTFDDGPDPDWTPRVVNVLAAEQATATFFMVGERVLAHPGTALSVVEAGQDVQLHCHRHVRHSELSELELQLDAEAGLAVLHAVGARPSLWRPPWGCVTGASVRVAERLGLSIERWTIDTHDWRGDGPGEMLDAVNGSLAQGGSVLMHDGLGPGARRAGCASTVALTSALLAAARSHGLRLTTMGESG